MAQHRNAEAGETVQDSIVILCARLRQGEVHHCGDDAHHAVQPLLFVVRRNPNLAQEVSHLPRGGKDRGSAVG